MFEFFKPNETGIYFKENAKIKQSKKDYEEVYGKMSLDIYNKKINVLFLFYLLLA